MARMIVKVCVLCCGCLLGAQASAADTSEVAALDQLVQRWIDSERQASLMNSEWLQQQPVLKQRLQLLREEKQQLQALLSQSKGSHSDVDTERSRLLEQQSLMEQQQAVMTAQLATLLQRLNSVELQLPPPLLEAWREEAGDQESDSLAAALSRLSKWATFNQKITLNEGAINNAAGEAIWVKQLYLGSAQAWFVSQDGQYQGRGLPSNDGWLWAFESDVDGTEIAAAIAMLEKNREAALVSLPILLQNDAFSTRSTSARTGAISL